jgi:hypothetical protein
MHGSAESCLHADGEQSCTPATVDSTRVAIAVARGGGGGGGEAGPPSRSKKEREGKVVAGPRAWLGRAPGRAARRGEGREGKRGVFPFLIYLLNV